jgi:prepilin-type N-terminal cleavage/methylation domain-containing protein
MSGSRRATEAQKGFTLIELLVALAIVAAVAALVAPASLRALYRAGATEKRLSVERALASLPDLARNAGKTLWLGGAGGDAIQLTLPAGWSLEALGSPIRYRHDGVCAGGRIRVTGDGAALRYRLQAPYCAPELE